jgi:hypothetical protein
MRPEGYNPLSPDPNPLTQYLRGSVRPAGGELLDLGAEAGSVRGFELLAVM